MRKIIVLIFLSLDGVMQAPGGPQEDPDGGFTLGGWTVPFFDEELGREMGEQMGKPFDLLLGRRTFEIFASYWPDHAEEGPEINNATKYVVSTSMTSHPWKKSVFLQTIEDVRQLKETAGPDLQVHGSATLIQDLLRHNLVDEFWLKIFPVVIGKGKRLFSEGTIPASFELTASKTTPAGVIIASYTREGEVKTGSF